MTSSFTTSRDRDAWSAIRGFVFQVDVTLMRWLNLAEGEILELERGEDIDRITSAPNEERLVEQVKAANQAVSLRNERALEALANAIDHLVSNPSVNIIFRFTTTAAVAREQEHPVRNGLPGIHLWENIRRGLANDDVEALDAVRILLVGAQRPRNIPSKIWEQAQQTFSDRSSLRDLVARFEWATGEPPTDMLANEILDVLQQSGRAPSRERAQRLYEQLFVRTFRLLARPGLKQLSLSDLEEEAARDGVADADRALVLTLRLAFDRLHGRLTEVEQHVRILGEQSRIAIGDGLPEPLSSPNFSMEELAKAVESSAGGRVEVLARHDDRLFLWLRRGKLEQKDAKFIILKVACLLSGVPGTRTLEIGFSDTSLLRGSRGDDLLGDWRVRVDLDDARHIAKSRAVPRDFWTRTEVILTAGDNLRVGERRLSVEEWEVGA
ncbi:hypothetical protein [Sorangium sp. So ce693]|uniref:hypothetical protein n=1 Tax=Sorangium sp. So ce693 TaxID=3133318 RepID=UPI003F5E5CA2